MPHSTPHSSHRPKLRHRAHPGALHPQKEQQHHRKGARAPGQAGGAAAFLAALPPQGGQRPRNQADEQPHRRLLGGAEKQIHQPGQPQHAHAKAHQQGHQLLPAAAEFRQGMGQEGHHQPVDAQGHAQHPAADAREDGAHADERPLAQIQDYTLIHIGSPFRSQFSSYTARAPPM